MAAIFGGIAGQEIIKACTSKFNPIHQFFYLDSLECLPDQDLPFEQYQPIGCRYDSNIIVFGKDFQEKVFFFFCFVC